MTHISRLLLATMTAAAMLAACTPPAGNEPARSEGTTSTEAAARAPDAKVFLELERQATEAFITGDSAFFERILSDKMVMQEGGFRLGKADALGMIADVRCEVEDGWALTEPQLSKIDDDTYVLTYKSSIDGSCTASGKTEKLPSPERASSVWVRNGEQWQTVFHGEIPIFDPATASEAGNSEEPDKKVPSETIAAAPRIPVKPASDAISDALMATERLLWDAWMKHDADRINELMAARIAFVNLFGTYFPDKAAALADWTSDACQVSSFMLNNGVGSTISPTVGILTVTGTVHGTCGGQDISGQKIYATTVYVKEGEAWKWAFGFNSPN